MIDFTKKIGFDIFMEQMNWVQNESRSIFRGSWSFWVCVCVCVCQGGGLNSSTEADSSVPDVTWNTEKAGDASVTC